MTTRWSGSDAPRGDAYDARWRDMAARGERIHGEADLVELLLREHGGQRVLDAGCGTGRVAIELAARGFTVVGVDLDPGMLAAARAKAPDLHWAVADLADLGDPNALGDLVGAEVASGFDLAVMAGNVVIFLEPGTEGAVLRALRARVALGGLLVAGFQLRPDRLSLADYDRSARAAGFELFARWATWDRQVFTESGNYAVSVHRAVAERQE